MGLSAKDQDHDQDFLSKTRTMTKITGWNFRLLTTFEKRRLRGDVIETYKIVTKKENIDPNQFFQFIETGHNFRGHSLKLSALWNTSRIRLTFFSQGVVTDWNRLPQHVIEAPSTNAFKNRLDKFWQQDMSIWSNCFSGHQRTSTSKYWHIGDASPAEWSALRQRTANVDTATYRSESAEKQTNTPEWRRKHVLSETTRVTSLDSPKNISES